MLSTLASLLDEIRETQLKIGFVCTASDVTLLDSSLRRPGRLDLEIEMAVPNANQRRQILAKLVEKYELSSQVSQEELENTAEVTHGFVGADLEALVLEALEHRDELNSEEIRIGKSLSRVKPSGMREVLLEVPKVTWQDIGGLDELKLALRQAVEWPLKRPDAFQKFGITPPKGLLMYGPPGCSKTMIAKALANESGLNFLAIKGPELFSKWVGESEKAVRELFRKAKQVAPAIIFFDEVDALGSKRGGSGSGNVGDRVLAQLLTEMDGIEQLRDVTVIAATNRPDMIDKALLRPGRLDRLFYVPLPDKETRMKIFNVHTRRKPIADDVNVNELAGLTENYSGAEIAAICNEAALIALEEDMNAEDVKLRHFQSALSVVKPRINADMTKIYKKFREEK